MKKIFICGLTLISLLIFGTGLIINNNNENVEYLRIHIRADSNNQLDQDVKYKVKDKEVEFLTPLLSTCKTKTDAETLLKSNLGNIENVANSVLEENGFSYKASVKINNEEFPTRVYDDFILEQGYYDALIINLGSGKGDNWWCVVYPPLCFTNSNSPYIYRSKILEIIKDFKKNKE